jgi:hypothetical protein
MAAQSLTLAGRKFVILPKSEYDKLRGRAPKNGAPRKGTSKSRGHRMTGQDRGDIAEVKRRLADPNDKIIPYEEARKRLGLG